MQQTQKPPVALITLTNSTTTQISEYDCEVHHVEEFARCFLGVWSRIPALPKFILDRHWTSEGRTLSVFLTEREPRRAERGLGYASSSVDGTELFCWSEVLPRIGSDVLTTTIAHELGHMAFIAIREPAHIQGKNRQAEWLIAELLAPSVWGFDQAAADEWFVRHMNHYEVPAAWRKHALTDEEYARAALELRKRLQDDAEKRRAYREERRLYFDVVAGTCSQEIEQIVRTSAKNLGEIVR
jgi:hypothetical protein